MKYNINKGVSSRTRRAKRNTQSNYKVKSPVP